MPDVEVRRRLVEEQHARRLGECAGDRDPLSLTPRELIDRPMSERAEVASRERLLDDACVLVRRPHPSVLVRSAAHEHDLTDGEREADLFALRDERNFTRHLATFEGGERRPEQSNVSTVRRQRPCHDSQERGLPCAVRADDREDLPRVNDETGVLERGFDGSGLGAVARVVGPDAGELDGGRFRGRLGHGRRVS